MISDPPCPDRPQLPPEPKLWTGDIEVRGTFAMLLPMSRACGVTSEDDVQEFAKRKVRYIERAAVWPGISLEIQKAEVFRDGE